MEDTQIDTEQSKEVGKKKNIPGGDKKLSLSLDTDDVIVTTELDELTPTNPKAFNAMEIFEAETSSTVPHSTFLDSGDEEDKDTPVVSWGNMTGTTMLLPVDDDELEESDEDMKSESSSQSTTAHNSLVPPQVRRKKRSPNRDDSDSEDEDGVKIVKAPEKEDDDLIDLNFNPFNDPEAIANGFKVGFSEDRNKKYRRTMEVLHRNSRTHTQLYITLMRLRGQVSLRYLTDTQEKVLQIIAGHMYMKYLTLTTAFLQAAQGEPHGSSPKASQ